MPWIEDEGGIRRNSGGSRGPWGQGPNTGGQGGGGPRGQQPPDLEELLKRGRDQFGSLIPGGRAGYVAIGLVIVLLWLLSGVYRVAADENGYVLRFGEHVSTTQPGLNWHIPYPVESVVTLRVTEQYNLTVGQNTLERFMLTGDENIVDIGFTIQYLIIDGSKYLFNVSEQENVIRSTAESAMREAVGQGEFLVLTTTGRETLQDDVVGRMQSILDTYDMGVMITEINLQDVNPHPEAVDAARDVQAAKADRERLQNEAQKYANEVVPIAEGQAARLIAEAEAYKQQTIAEAEGQAQRFIAVYDEYRLAPDVTRQRIFLETMESVLSGTDKIILDEDGGAIPYLPLDQLKKRSQ